jgi:hypothetical protein
MQVHMHVLFSSTTFPGDLWTNLVDVVSHHELSSNAECSTMHRVASDKFDAFDVRVAFVGMLRASAKRRTTQTL